MKDQQNGPELGEETAIEESTAAKQIETKGTQNQKAMIENEEIVRKAADKLIAPKKVSFVAQLLDVQQADSTKTNNIVLTFGLPDGTTKTLWVAPGFWEKLGTRFAIDGFVRVESEITEEGKTSYFDQDTKSHFYHTKDGERFIGMSRVTEKMFEKEAPINLGDIELINNAAGTHAMAIATYLGNYRR